MNSSMELVESNGCMDGGREGGKCRIMIMIMVIVDGRMMDGAQMGMAFVKSMISEYNACTARRVRRTIVPKPP